MLSMREQQALERAKAKARQPKEQETNTVGSEQLLVLSNNAMAINAVNAGLTKAPTFMYPDNPAMKQGVFATLGLNKLMGFLPYLSPLFLGALWYNFFKSAKRFYTAENRNLARYADVFVSFASAVGWTVLYAVGMGAVGAAIVKAAPYLLIGILGVKAVTGFVNCIKNIYYAITTHDKEARKQYLWNAAKQAVSVVTYSLGLVASVLLGIKMQAAVAHAKESFVALIASMKAAGSLFQTAVPVVYGLVGSAILGAAMDTKEMNEKTWHAVTHPAETLKNTWNKIRNNPLQVFPAIMKLVVHTGALAFAPLQLLGYGVKKLVSLVSSKLTTAKKAEPVVVDQHAEKHERYSLIIDLQKHIQQNEKKGQTKQIMAKLISSKGLLERMEASAEEKNLLPSVDDVERNAKMVSSKVHCSLFREKGQTQELSEKVRQYEAQYCQPRMGASISGE